MENHKLINLLASRGTVANAESPLGALEPAGALKTGVAIKRRRTPCAQGITLIELMVVVAIVAILAVIAYPAYRDHVLKTRRSEAKAALTDAASREEQFYLDNKTYTQTIGTAGLNMASSTQNGSYVISVDAPTTSCPITGCYALRATPQGPQTDDTRCGTLTLDSGGQRSATGTAPTTCW